MADKHEVKFEGQTFDLRTGRINGYVMALFMDAVTDADPNAQIPPRTLLKLIRACVIKDDWRRFEDLACDIDEDDQGFWDKAWDAIIAPRMKGPVEEETDHPIGQLSVSTDGPEVIPAKSESSSGAKILQLSHGRPDRYWMLDQAREAVARSSRSA